MLKGWSHQFASKLIPWSMRILQRRSLSSTLVKRDPRSARRGVASSRLVNLKAMRPVYHIIMVHGTMNIDAFFHYRQTTVRRQTGKEDAHLLKQILLAAITLNRGCCLLMGRRGCENKQNYPEHCIIIKTHDREIKIKNRSIDQCERVFNASESSLFFHPTL